MTRRERLERLAERRRDWAEGRQKKAAAIQNNEPSYAHDWAFITQPGHIPARARLNAQTERAMEHSDMAQHHTAKAGGIERQLETTIFSDDPDAIEAIQEKIAKLEKWQEATKQVNRLVRKGDREGLAALGLSPAAVAALFVPDFAGRVGVPGYALTNNNANIRRLRERIKEIQHRQTLTQTAVAAGGCVIVGKWDYVNVIFSEKPDRSIIEALKAAGFHWGSGRWCGKRDQLPECVLQQAGTIEPESPSETGGAS